MPIPIFQIPILVTKLIMACMEEVEVVMVSLCSKRAERVLNSCKKVPTYFDLGHERTQSLNDWQRLVCYLLAANRCAKEDLPKRELHVSISNVVTVKVEHFATYSNHSTKYLPSFTFHIDCLSNLQGRGIWKNVVMGDHFLPVTIQKDGRFNETYTYWNNVQMGLMAVLELFNIGNHWEIQKLELRGKNGFPRNFNLKNFISDLISRQAKVNNIDISFIPDADFKYILDRLKVKECIYASNETRPDFKFSGKFRAKEVSISEGSWFKRKHLLRFHRKKLDVHGSEIKLKDVNQFLELWQAGRFPKLEELKLSLKETTDGWDFPGFQLPRRPMAHRDRRQIDVRWEGVIDNRKVSATISTWSQSAANRVHMRVHWVHCFDKKANVESSDDSDEYDEDEDDEEEPMNQEEQAEDSDNREHGYNEEEEDVDDEDGSDHDDEVDIDAHEDEEEEEERGDDVGDEDDE